jgi:hypothetical protein
VSQDLVTMVKFFFVTVYHVTSLLVNTNWKETNQYFEM